MRIDKKLFGGANAPFCILHPLMKQVDKTIQACFELLDQPRMHVEPASREVTPIEEDTLMGSSSDREVFCICCLKKAGIIIKYELCNE